MSWHWALQWVGAREHSYCNCLAWELVSDSNEINLHNFSVYSHLSILKKTSDTTTQAPSISALSQFSPCQSPQFQFHWALIHMQYTSNLIFWAISRICSSLHIWSNQFSGILHFLTSVETWGTSASVSDTAVADDNVTIPFGGNNVWEFYFRFHSFHKTFAAQLLPLQDQNPLHIRCLLRLKVLPNILHSTHYIINYFIHYFI